MGLESDIGVGGDLAADVDVDIDTDAVIDNLLKSVELRAFLEIIQPRFYSMDNKGYAFCIGGKNTCAQDFMSTISVHPQMNEAAQAELQAALADCQAFWQARMQEAAERMQTQDKLPYELYTEFTFRENGLNLMLSRKH